jgi:peroxiredoxin
VADPLDRLLGVGDRAPDFDLPAADRDGRISLSDYYRRGPVLLLLLRGLYCSFCRRHISRLKSSCDMLQSAGIPMLGVVIASAERSRLYFRYRNAPCFSVAAAPDRSVHRAYGLPAVVRTPEMIAVFTASPPREPASTRPSAIRLRCAFSFLLDHESHWIPCRRYPGRSLLRLRASSFTMVVPRGPLVARGPTGCRRDP